MPVVTRAEMMADPRWWRVGVITIPLSLLLMGLGYICLQLASGKVHTIPLLDGFLTMTLGGLLIFGPFVYTWGIIVGLLLWPLIWNLSFVRCLGAPRTAAICAFFIAVLAGALPFGVLAYPNLNSFAGFFFVPALIAVVVGPFVAYRVYQPPVVLGA